MIQIIILLYFSYKCNVIIRYLLLGIIFFEKKQPIICSFKNKLYLCIAFERQSYSKCPDGGIGRRVGLKHQWIHFHPGSIPGLGTFKELLTAIRLKLNANAQMAELVDALVSNTNGFTSIPVRSRVWVQIKRLSD